MQQYENMELFMLRLKYCKVKNAVVWKYGVIYPAFHGTMVGSQKSARLVRRCHQLMSGFLAKGYLPPVSRQSRRSLMIRVIIPGLCTDRQAFVSNTHVGIIVQLNENGINTEFIYEKYWTLFWSTDTGNNRWYDFLGMKCPASVWDWCPISIIVKILVTANL